MESDRQSVLPGYRRAATWISIRAAPGSSLTATHVRAGYGAGKRRA